MIKNPTETTKKKTQQTRSINKEIKRRSSHEIVFEFTFYTDPVLNVEIVFEQMYGDTMLTLTILIVVDR